MGLKVDLRHFSLIFIVINAQKYFGNIQIGLQLGQNAPGKIPPVKVPPVKPPDLFSKYSPILMLP